MPEPVLAVHTELPEHPQTPFTQVSAFGTPAQSALVAQPHLCVVVLHFVPPACAEQSPSPSQPQTPVVVSQKSSLPGHAPGSQRR